MIMKPFNKLYWAMIIGALTIAIGLGLLAKYIDLKLAREILIVICFINIVVYLVYKIYLPYDEEYAKIAEENDIDRSCFWNEMLPLQLCNIGLVIEPIALITKNVYLLSFCSFLSPFSTFMAVTMPCVGFEKYSILKLRNFGFYFTHITIFIVSICFWSTGLFVPEYSYILPTLGLSLCFSTLAHIVNLLLRKFTDCKRVNYLFTMNPAGNPALGFFYKLIPVPYLYHFPMTIVLAIVLLLVTFIYKLF